MDIRAMVLSAACNLHELLDQAAQQPHHSLGAAVRLWARKGLLPKELSTRCYRLAKSADAMRHLTPFAIAKVVREVEELGMGKDDYLCKDKDHEVLGLGKVNDMGRDKDHEVLGKGKGMGRRDAWPGH